ncbi:MAG: hypothetical protein ACLQBA_25750 [Candidatus Binataceae bacterium]
MDAQALVIDFDRRGIRLIPNPPKLTVKPSAKLTDEDRAAIRTNKAELLALALARDEAETARIAALDRQRNARDRARGRGYDYAFQPEQPASRQPAPLDPAIAAEIGRIEDEALAIGWSHARLWGADFWPVEGRGLAALLDAGDQIGAVTADYIEILKVERHLLRFQRRAS